MISRSLLRNFLLLSFCVITACPSIKADVRVPSIIGDHMVLKANSRVAIWGWASAAEIVRVRGIGPEASDTTDHYGHWKVFIETPSYGGPYTLQIQGQNSIEVKDVMIGEVWLCSGQSNMEWSARWGIDNAMQEVMAADYPFIRFFNVKNRGADHEQLDLEGEWTACNPSTMFDFSAVGYFFGREIFRELGIPVGLINSSWGGTPVETWISEDFINSQEIYREAAAKTAERKSPWWPTEAGALYNAMIAPLTPFVISGALWYQGESNVPFPGTYDDLLAGLITNWRSEWGSDFPFYYVQIAPFRGYRDINSAFLREAQLKVLTVPNTGMVVVSDIGDLEDIHPRNKQDVGKRLAAWALSHTYGLSEIVPSGPLYRGFEIEEDMIRVFFDFADNGLVAQGGPLEEFEIAGEDGEFHKAQARIDDNTVLVYSGKVKNPLFVRFGWSNVSNPQLFNAEGLPASSFRNFE